MFIAMAALSVVVQPPRASTEGPCIRIDRPMGGTVLTQPLCTLSVEACEDIHSASFQVRYLAQDGNSTKSINLGRLTRPPYKVVWNTDTIPNQDYTGLTFYAKVLLPTGKVVSLRQEGVFLIHQTIPTPTLDVAHFDPRFDKAPATIVKLNGDNTITGSARIAWNNKSVLVHIRVQDALFYEDIPAEKRSNLGCEFLFDLSQKRLPYPADSVLMIDIPLDGEPLLKRFTPVFDHDGTYRIETTTTPFGGKFQIERFVGKGWGIKCTFDKQTLGLKTIPSSLRCNLIARVETVNEKNQTLAWIPGNYARQHSPSRWGTLTFVPRPLTKNPWLQWGTAFLVGFALALVITLLVTDPRPKGDSVARFELTEEEKHLVEQVRELVEQGLTTPDLSLSKAAAELHTDPRKLNRLLKKYLSQSFDTYLARARVEVAKERLRSSNSGEKAIAEMCGFTTVSAMEKAFQNIYKITPYNYRTKQQVT